MNLKKIVKQALEEDIGSGDITSAVVPENKASKTVIFSREQGILCGINIAKTVFLSVDKETEFNILIKDKTIIKKNQIVAEIYGKTRSLLTAERTALNFLQHLSGIATTTRLFVDKAKDYKAEIYDTRKTIPGLREIEKYAVRCGNGHNHRLGLYDMILIKDNHLKAAGSVKKAVKAVRKKYPKKPVEVEAKTINQVREALAAKADIIMLDNMSKADIIKSIKLIKKKAVTELSGNITLANIRDYAKLGANRISIGSALTLSSKALDFSMKITGCTH